ncbi:MAG: sigma-70 family RNA polymerase sigma factor [bacterium]|nr:sigma-70 family RNA polymerase sigma factor [bacterium]
MDDLTIVELYHRRDERAIVETDKKYGALCRSIALRLLGLREDAEECVNDTWHMAWNKMPPDRPQCLSAFLGRITRNLSVSRWRRDHAQKRYGGVEVLLSELEDCVPTPGTVEEKLEREQLAQAISEWLDGLEDENRRLFIRRYWYGDPVKRLAAEREEKANAISQRLLRLRKELRAFLEAKGMEV